MKNFGDLSALRRPVLGLYVSIPDPALVEMAYNAGFGFIRIDMEHILFGYNTLAELIRTACLLKMPVQVRISDLTDITKLLDQGVCGIVCPDVENVQQAKAVIERAKYAPIGNRGMFPVARYAKFGLEPFDTYTKDANDYVSVAVQLESLTAIENIDSILSLEGIDMVASGKADLSQSMGLIGQTGHPKVIEAENLIIKKALAYGKEPSMLAGSKKRVHELWDMGVKLITLGPDTNLIAECYKKTVETMF